MQAFLCLSFESQLSPPMGRKYHNLRLDLRLHLKRKGLSTLRISEEIHLPFLENKRDTNECLFYT
ncbi:hypothetical protein CW304_03650 [Bacillus sp. UFRGS-B20]|nr:hypothetical protein CW304_03650 [Bacillus sp. UFRGS-B20]